jgi:hypothetical protein
LPSLHQNWKYVENNELRITCKSHSSDFSANWLCDEICSVMKVFFLYYEKSIACKWQSFSRVTLIINDVRCFFIKLVWYITAELRMFTKFALIFVTVRKGGTKFIGKNLENVFGSKQNDKKSDLLMFCLLRFIKNV